MKKNKGECTDILILSLQAQIKKNHNNFKTPIKYNHTKNKKMNWNDKKNFYENLKWWHIFEMNKFNGEAANGYMNKNK